MNKEARTQEFYKYHNTFEHKHPWAPKIDGNPVYPGSTAIDSNDGPSRTPSFFREYRGEPEKKVNDDYQSYINDDKKFTPTSSICCPRLYNISKEVSQEFGIRMPVTYALYDYSEIAYAVPEHNSIVIALDVVDALSDKQLKALVAHEIKHLYQHPPLSREEYHANELDADRAEIKATDIDTHNSLNIALDHIQEERWSQMGAEGKVSSWVKRTLKTADEKGFDKFTDLVRTVASRHHPKRSQRNENANQYWQELINKENSELTR